MADGATRFRGWRSFPGRGAVLGVVTALGASVVVVFGAVPAGAAPVTADFAYVAPDDQTPAAEEVQTWTVPAGVCSVDVEAVGGAGAAGTAPAGTTSLSASGGLGGSAVGTIPVTPGETLEVRVGGSATGAAGGFNGGGDAPFPPQFASAGGGGGGASDVRRVGSDLASRVLVAPGGGGGGAVRSQGTPIIPEEGAVGAGGAGGGAAGTAGDAAAVVVGGGPGTASAGGAAGPNAGNGEVGQGGGGGFDYVLIDSYLVLAHSGGGGGGWFGGGGGGANIVADTEYSFRTYLRGSGGGGGSGFGPAGVVYGSLSGVPRVRISYDPAVVTCPPVNDDFGAATVLTGLSGSSTGSSVLGSVEPGEPQHASPPDNGATASVWYRLTPGVSGVATVDTEGSDFDTLLAVYTGTAVGDLTEVASNDDGQLPALTSRVTFPVVRNTTYWIAVDGWDGTTGSVTLNHAVAAPRPDGRIRVGTNGVLRGNNVYNTLTDQSVQASAAARVGLQVVYSITVQNDAAFADSLVLRGSGSTAQFRVAYRVAGIDRTAAVVAGTYATPVLAPGAVHTIRAKVTVAASAPATASLARTLKATSVLEPLRHDTVRFTTRRR